MTIEKALRRIAQIYDKAQKMPYIRNPLAYALYQVWKAADRCQAEEKQSHERAKEVRKNEQRKAIS